MDSPNKKPSNPCRLPEGIEVEDLCMMKGAWPKRELSAEELLETYKKHYSAGSRSEAMLVLDAFRKKYGESIWEVVKELYYELGKEEGEAAKRHYGSLLNAVIDFSVRPHCYEIEHCQSTPERIVYKIVRCRFADVLRKMGLEEVGQHTCPPAHKGWADAFGVNFSMPRFLLAGDDCCEHIWEQS